MKNLCTLLVCLVLFTSCAVQIDSVVDNSLIKEPYSNPLIVIPYESYRIEQFSNSLKEHFEEQFGADQRDIEIFIVQSTGNPLVLNGNRPIEEKINHTIISDGKDLLLFFQPTNMEYGEGGYRVFTYQVTGIDTKSEKEVWKANFTAARGHLGAEKMAEKSAKIIYDTLKSDDVL